YLRSAAPMECLGLEDHLAVREGAVHVGGAAGVVDPGLVPGLGLGVVGVEALAVEAGAVALPFPVLLDHTAAQGVGDPAQAGQRAVRVEDVPLADPEVELPGFGI